MQTIQDNQIPFHNLVWSLEETYLPKNTPLELDKLWHFKTVFTAWNIRKRIHCPINTRWWNNRTFEILLIFFAAFISSIMKKCAKQESSNLAQFHQLLNLTSFPRKTKFAIRKKMLPQEIYWTTMDLVLNSCTDFWKHSLLISKESTQSETCKHLRNWGVERQKNG